MLLSQFKCRTAYEEAIASCDRAIQIQPDYPYSWYNKACCYALQGDVDLAIENLQQAIDLRLENREYVKTDSHFDAIRENELFKKLVDNYTDIESH